MQPYTDHELEPLANSGVRKLLLTCPAFGSDCLETLAEIGIRGRETFRTAGGSELALIPCLNDHQSWLRALQVFVKRFQRPSKEETDVAHAKAA